MERSTTELLRAASGGDEIAWTELVDRYSRLVWSVIRARGVTGERAADVYQTTWLRLIENRDHIRDPERLAGWLATTARNEVTRVGRLRARIVNTELREIGDHDADPSLHVTDADVQTRIWEALMSLSDQCRRLLGLLATAPDLSYTEIGEILDMPVGSIGPTRARCLDKLRAVGAVRAILQEDQP